MVQLGMMQNKSEVNGMPELPEVEHVKRNRTLRYKSKN